MRIRVYARHSNQWKRLQIAIARTSGSIEKLQWKPQPLMAENIYSSEGTRCLQYKQVLADFKTFSPCFCMAIQWKEMEMLINVEAKKAPKLAPDISCS